jgi:hypothetical protein
LIDANAPSKTNAANNGVDVGGGSGIVSFSCVRNVMLKKKKKQDNFNKCSASLPKSQKQQNENELVFLVLSQAMPSRLNKSTRVSFWSMYASKFASCRLPRMLGRLRGEYRVSSRSLRKPQNFSGPRSWVMPLQVP